MWIEPFFSIIIPVYNAENYISKCIDSILKQSFTNFLKDLEDDQLSRDGGRETFCNYTEFNEFIKGG